MRRDSSYAPAYTSLGIYYADISSPPDPKRASKCFQKAFELDPREVEAARRLADNFANDREWDLVDVIANRIIEGEGGLEGGVSNMEKSALARAKPTNAWAWKALGVADLVSAPMHIPIYINILQIRNVGSMRPLYNLFKSA